MSSLVSKGEWRAWQRTVLSYLPEGRVLEIAFGTGNLLLDMAAAGREPYGLDLSPQMVHLTLSKLRRQKAQAHLCRARAQSLPFPDGSFSAVVLTFPADFIGEARTAEEIWRVLVEGGKLILVEGGRLRGRDPWSRLLNRGLTLGGVSGPARWPVQGEGMRAGGFEIRVEEKRLARSSVQVLVATRESGNQGIWYQPT